MIARERLPLLDARPARRSPTAASRPSRASTSPSAQGELVCLIGANGAGKTTTLKGICGLQPVKSRRDPLRRRRHHRAGRAFELRAPRARDGARRPRHVRRADDRGEPRDGRLHARRPRGDPRRRRARVRAVSAAQGAAPADGRHAVGRRAADARDRPRADVAAEAAAARRAVDGPRAADGAEGVRDVLAVSQGRRDDPADRAERQARARSERPRLRDGVGRDHARRATPKTLLHDPKVRAAYLGENL